MIAKCTGNYFGKENRGRKFLSPVSRASVDADGRMVNPRGFDAQCQAIVVASLNVGGNVLDPVLWSQPPHAANKIIVGSCANLSGIQKRRRVRLPN
jgi:hypothetical protein